MLLNISEYIRNMPRIYREYALIILESTAPELIA